ncbi:ras-related protein Rab-24-like [Chelonus insularis]|uniref:ras-related protein Rab-24-like n=1 Tax=Chelonus insularis TaxID=460826 RepID=UPI0015885C90|nr:ras-related protein Rab-24-like [Chelonus insularis]
MNRVDLKVVLLGNSEVGKTSLLERYVNERFNESMAYQNTIGAAYAAKNVEVDDKTITLGIWDTAGTERYNAMVRIYYRDAKAAIVCYDITNQASFNRARVWIQELRSQEEECKIYLCATKKDLIDNDQTPTPYEPSPSLEMVQRYADGIGSKFFITSSKTGENVAQLFQEIARDYASNPANVIIEKTINLSVLSNNKKKHCCGKT